MCLFDPMDYSPPVSSVHGILQARMLEYVAISSSKGSSWSRNGTCLSCIGRQILYHWATGIVFKFLLCFYISPIDKHSKNCLLIEEHVKPPLLYPVIDETWLLPWGTCHTSMCTACKMTVKAPTVLKLSSQGISAFQSQRRTVPKNVQTTVQLRSVHTLPR